MITGALEPLRLALVEYLEEQCRQIDSNLSAEFSWNQHEETLVNVEPQGFVYLAGGKPMSSSSPDHAEHYLNFYLRLLVAAATNDELLKALEDWAYQLVVKPDSVLRSLRFGTATSAVDATQLDKLRGIEIVDFKSIPAFSQDTGGIGRLIITLQLRHFEQQSFSF